MRDLLEAKYRRRVFFTLVVILLMLLLVLRFFVLPAISDADLLTWDVIASRSLETIFGAVVASVAVTSLILWLSPSARQKAVMEIIPPFRIKETLEEARGKTGEWWYRGHSGRHFRAVAIPALAKQARTANVTKRIVLQILDPTSDAVCSNYSAYRQALHSAIRDQPWTSQRVRLELYATIVSSYAWKTQEPLLDITIALIEKVSLFRVDLSSRLALVTKEDPREPALRFDEGTIFYNSYKEDLRLSLKQARELPRDVAGPRLTELNEENVRELLQNIGLVTPVLEAQDIQSIIDIAQKAENPYGWKSDWTNKLSSRKDRE